MESWRDNTLEVQNHLLKVNNLSKVNDKVRFALIKTIRKFKSEIDDRPFPKYRR